MSTGLGASESVLDQGIPLAVQDGKDTAPGAARAGRGQPLTLAPLDPASFVEWDAFVSDHPAATFFHLSGWKRVIESTLGHRCHHLMAQRGGQICGVLPLVHVRSRLFSNALISSGFSVCGGPLADDEGVEGALVDAAISLAQSLGVEYLEFRLQAPSERDWARNDQLYVGFCKELDPDPEKNLLAIPRKQRAMVRKGIKIGLESEFDGDIARFYPVYSESVRNLGTPVLPRRYFAALKQIFGERCEILTVHQEGRPVSSVLNFRFRDTVLPYYGGGTASARAVAGNDFMYWEVMRRACEQGTKFFDFGRSKRDTGAFAFKRHWGFEPQPLAYEYKLLTGEALPALNPTNPKYSRVISLWRRLPLPVANTLGPFIARNLG